MDSAASLKIAQLKAVNRMLAFNDEHYLAGQSNGGDMLNGGVDDDYTLPPAGSSHNQWKILVYDIPCRSIISPLLSVAQLRRRGVTLHLLLQSEREPIPHVPVIYFCQPTAENLARIAKDCAQGLYGKAYLNFVTKLDRGLMEDFCKLLLQSGSLETIASLHDQYLDYVCLERNLFSLHRPNSYVTINNPHVTDDSIEQSMTDIAYGLFSVVATMGHVPIIRCPRNGAPEMVARKLNQMIADHPTLLRSSKSSSRRPLLVLQDRNADLMTPIQHTSTYQALIDDLLSHTAANRVEFDVMVGGSTGNDAKSTAAAKKVHKKYDLDPDLDPFYSKHKFNPFPEAIEQNGVELQQVTQREMEIRSKAATTGGGTSSLTSVQDPNAPSSDLANAVDSLPALLDRKKQLEVHTSILQAVMGQVASRDVPQFYELESQLASGYFKNDPAKAKKTVLSLVTDPTKGNVNDKIRLVLVYCLATTAKSSDVDEVSEAMTTALETKGSTASAPSAAPSGAANHGTLSAADRQELANGTKAIAYIRQLRSVNMMIPMASDETVSSSSLSSSALTADTAMLSSFMKSAQSQATGFLAKASEKVGGMMMGKIHKHHLTRVVEHLIDMKAGTEDDTYLYLDPKIKGDINVMALRNSGGSGGGGGGPGGMGGGGNMNRAPIRDIIAFCIGGGCYSEYQNLQMVTTQDGRRSVTYGSTELLDPCKFLLQLGQLA